jgi:hypothetical protein
MALAATVGDCRKTSVSQSSQFSSNGGGGKDRIELRKQALRGGIVRRAEAVEDDFVSAYEGDALAIVELHPIVLQQRREQLGLHHSIHWRIAIFAMKGVDAGDTRQREQGLELQRYIRFDQRLSRHKSTG